jgi:DNA-binding SARP family transcriptional activator
MKNNLQLPKITKPRNSGVLLRERLFGSLDESRKQPIVWVAGPAGTGKTTLVSSYLDARKLPHLWYQADSGDSDVAAFFYYMGMAAKKAAPRYRKPLPILSPEYLQGLTAFAAKFFESLYGRLRPPFVLVLDNYQAIPVDSPLHEIIKGGVSILPDDLNVIIISRTEPLKTFARLRANKKVAYLGSGELNFSLEETTALIRTQKYRELTAAETKSLYKKIGGWAAGLVLLMERWKTADFNIQSLEILKQDEIFDYFANEIFEKVDSEIQNFLLRTAFFPEIDPRLAEKVSGDRDAGRKLSYLSRNHYFTARRSLTHPVYQYHELFRDFLLARAKSFFPEKELQDLRMNAAVLLEQSGMTEGAAQLFIELRSYEELARLIINNAALLLSQGRNKTLESWISVIPQTQIDASPWLLYWLGASRLSGDIFESRSCFERAFEKFKAEDNPAGLYLSWAGVVMTYIYAWGDFRPLDPWISEMEELLARHPVFPSFQVEAQAAAAIYSALMFRQPQHPDFSKWHDRMKELIHIVPDTSYKMTIGTLLAINYAVVFGDFFKAEEIINELRPIVRSAEIPPLTLITWYATLARYYWFSNLHDDCRKAVRNGMDVAEANGVHLMDFRILSEEALNHLTSGDYPAAAGCLNKLDRVVNRASYTDVGLYNYLLFVQAMHHKDFHRAERFARTALDLSLKTGYVLVETIFRAALALVLIEKGEHEEAAGHLKIAKKSAFAMNCLYVEFICLICEARSAFDQGRDEAGFGLLREGLAIGRGKQKFLNMCTFPPHFLTWMCKKALGARIEVEYVHKLIRKRNLVPFDPPLEIEDWPWPLRIYALGTFQLVKDKGPVVFKGKVQQKPLAMLKVVIAMGGKEVPEEQITDILWPDVDGDLAHKSFETTLHRLRLLIVNDKALRLKDGLLSLDPRYCWVDVWAFERLFDRIKKMSPGSEEIAALTEKAVTLYKGHFLAADADSLGALSKRERLRAKFLRLVTGYCEHLEAAGEWDKAVQMLQRGLEIDALAEEFYQHLMLCYHKAGLESEALRMYNQCSSVLGEKLGIKPSSKTEALRAQIRKPR